MQKKGKRILNKKQIVSFLIGLLTILILIMGSSYAYFSVEVRNSNSNTIITATTEQVAVASLSQGVKELKLNLSLNNMKQSNAGNYYADDENDYAPNKSLGYHDFATLTLSNSKEDNNIYRCSMNVNIEFDTSENSIGSAIKKDDLKIHFMIGNQNYEYDLSDYKNTGRLSQEIETEIIGNSDKILYGYIELRNKETEQNYLAGKKINITINTTLNNCELTGKKGVFAVLESYSSNKYKSDEYKKKIKNISFVDYIDTDNAIVEWDLTQTSGERKSPAGSVIGWLEKNEDETYNLFIGTQSSNQVIFVKSLAVAFEGMTGLESVKFSNLNTSITTNIAGLFHECENIISLDLSTFDISKVVDMRESLAGISKINNINLDNFNTKNVTNFIGTFTYTGFNIININNLITTNVTSMGSMFRHTNLIELNLNNFDTSQVTTMGSMFTLNEITSLDLSSFTSDNLKDVTSMFYFSNIDTIDMRNMDFANVTNYGLMFTGFQGNEIIVKDEENKKWIEQRLAEAGTKANVKVAN